jgi:hypothetical protein
MLCQGALLCLAAAAVGLGEPSEAYLRQIVPPVLASFTDQDSRVRYYACEALYNIAKVSDLHTSKCVAVLIAIIDGALQPLAVKAACSQQQQCSCKVSIG